MNKAIFAAGLLSLTYQNQNGQEVINKNKFPNLLIIVADQWRGQALGLLGNEPVITPNLDRLARRSVLFTQAVSGYPVSSPARAMLMTGMYPLSNHVTSNCSRSSAPFGVELSKDVRCWSDILSDQGYLMGYIGKWHLDAPHEPYVKTSNPGNEWTPPERRHGFSYWYSYGIYDEHTNPMYWDSDDSRENFSYVNQWSPDHETGKAMEFIENSGGKPFALVLSMNPPHMKYDLVPEKYKKMYESITDNSICKYPNIPPAGSEWGDFYRKNIRNYYALITGVDINIGRLINYLNDKGLFDNTLLVFTSDHGNCLGIHNKEAKNNFYEESVRVPLIISYPEKLSPSVNNELLISFEDLYPTLLSLMGFKAQLPVTLETRNLSGQILGKGNYPEYQPYMQCQFDDITSGFRGVRTIRFTYAVRFEKNDPVEVFLFDRLKDPFQMKNIAGTDINIEKHLNHLTSEWMNRAKDPLLLKISKALIK